MSANRTSSFFDSYAEDFNLIYGNKNTILNRIVNPLLRKSMRIRFDKTIKNCMPVNGKSIIDIGCGPGHYSVELAKRGAGRVVGLDFAQIMIDIARRNAKDSKVAETCQFITGDFVPFAFDEVFDYSIVMGFMDYCSDALSVMEKVISITKGKAFFSFPVDGGILALQRRIRYRNRCDLFMYTEEQLDNLLARMHCKRYEIQRIARDFYVSVEIK